MTVAGGCDFGPVQKKSCHDTCPNIFYNSAMIVCDCSKDHKTGTMEINAYNILC